MVFKAEKNEIINIVIRRVLINVMNMMSTSFTDAAEQVCSEHHLLGNPDGNLFSSLRH
jgi:hypothetical protein